MTVTNGWPGKPGVPMHPEKDRWHWVSLLGSGHPQIMEWFSDAMVWADGWTVEACAKHLRYLGPVLTPDEVQNLRDDLASAERERAHQHGRADRNAAEHAREQAKREALQKRVAELEGALSEMVYEATHLSPEEDDGSHWCKISKGALVKARAALTGGKDER